MEPLCKIRKTGALKSIMYRVYLRRMCEVVLSRILSPWYWPNIIFRLSSLGAKQRKALTVIHGFTNEVIAKRSQELKNSKSQNLDDEDEGM